MWAHFKEITHSPFFVLPLQLLNKNIIRQQTIFTAGLECFEERKYFVDESWERDRKRKIDYFHQFVLEPSYLVAIAFLRLLMFGIHSCQYHAIAPLFWGSRVE